MTVEWNDPLLDELLDEVLAAATTGAFTRPCPDCFDGLIRSQDDLRPHRRCGGSGRVPGEGDGR